LAEWQSGHAADCKSVYAGSIPTSASIKIMKKITKAIIPVAGFGTRMLPATKAIPKELLPIVDKPLIQYILEEAIQGGIKEIIFVTRSGKEAIENHFDENFELEDRLESSGKRKMLKSIKNLIPKGIKISSLRQKNPKGLGHAILCAEHVIKEENFAVFLPDEILLSSNKKNDFSKMMSFYNKNGEGQILVEKVKKSEVSNYGIIDINSKRLNLKSPKRIKKLVEKPNVQRAPSNFRVVGRYILPFQLMTLIKRTPPDKSGEVQLTDAIDKLIKLGEKPINAVLSDSKIFDCGSKKGFLGANISIAIKDKELRKYIKRIID
tara:strand:+ start:317 stop:1279 length:963 start_codon:yes stop_codon:yes gene_type:complete